MPTYNFKKDLKLYVVRGANRYRLDVYPDVSFSQTFNETAVPVKTLHSQFDMFENAVINKANPANFNFTIPLNRDSDFDTVLNLLLAYDSTNPEASIGFADYYIEMNSETYKLEKAVIESAVFRIAKDQIMIMTCSGTASKLIKYVGALPGILQSKNPLLSYTAPNILELRVGGVVRTNILGVSLEVKNNVQWVDNATLHDSLAITDASGSIYPGAFVVQNRQVSGNIQQYVTDETSSTANVWSNGQSLLIRATDTVGSGWLLQASLPAVVYTNRVGLDEFLTQTYDFRMTASTTDLTNIIQRG